MTIEKMEILTKNNLLKSSGFSMLIFKVLAFLLSNQPIWSQGITKPHSNKIQIKSSFILPTTIKDPCNPDCKNIAWMNWKVITNQKYFGSSNRGSVILDVDPRAINPLSGLYSLLLGNSIFTPKNLDLTPTPHMPGLSNVKQLIHRIRLDSVKADDAFIVVGSFPNSNVFSNRPQTGKLRAYDANGILLDLSGVCQVLQDRLNPPLLSNTIININQYEITLLVDNPGNADGALVFFRGFPANTNYIEAEHNNDQSSSWDGIYINVGLPDCCPVYSITNRVIACTDSLNRFTYSARIIINQPHPLGELHVLIDNVEKTIITPPFQDTLSLEFTGLNPDGNQHVFAFYFELYPDCIQTYSFIAPEMPVSPVIHVNNPICEADTLLFNTGSGIAFQWTGPNGFNSMLRNPNILAGPSSAGDYHLTLTDQFGCKMSSSVNVQVLRNTYTNLIKEGCDVININGRDYVESGIYYQTLVNAEGCDSLLKIELSIDHLTTSTLHAGNDTILCEGEILQLKGSYEGSGQFSWLSGKGTFDQPDSLYTEYFPTVTGNHLLFLRLMNLCGSITDSLLVSVLPIQYIQISGNHQADPCKQNIFTASGAQSYRWTPAHLFECLDPFCSQVKIKTPGTYQISVSSDEPCIHPAQSHLTVLASQTEIFVPNTFSPNGDNINDFFKPVITCDQLESYQLQIFDRWGNLLFNTREIDSGWNGEFHNEKLNTAVFTWLITYRLPGAEEKVLKGDVTLIR